MQHFPSALLFLLFSLIAAPAFAGLQSRGGPSTTNNNDTCDIALLPAATLLLPYFEVDLSSRSGETTVFTVTNVSNSEQIAHVTLWTNRAYPILNFNLYLTGYDTQSINLQDVIRFGNIAPPDGTGIITSPTGEFSRPNYALQSGSCADLATQLSPALLRRTQQALTTGTAPAAGESPACTGVGDRNPNNNAVGYVTIDVVGSCTTRVPTETAYYTNDIRYDNVLIGEYKQVNDGQHYAQGGPLVHIRAMRDASGKTNFPDTFYGRFQSAAQPGLDARQPLPSAFAARFINGGAGSFETLIKIWRQGWTGPDVPCEKYKCNAKLQVNEFVTFDDEENAVGAAPDDGPICTPIVLEFITSAVVKAEVDDSNDFFPAPFDDAANGWVYMNLSSDNEIRPRQAWVISSMRAEGRFSTDTDVMALGNGCSPQVALSEVDLDGSAVIGPAPNVTP